MAVYAVRNVLPLDDDAITGNPSLVFVSSPTNH